MPGMTTAFAEGVAASRPAAASTNAGYLYYATDTQILSQSNGSSWTQIAAGVALDLLSAKGDLLTRSGSAYARLGVGSNDQVLTADSTAGNGIKWATPASGFSDPMSSAGDLIIRNGSNATTRLGIGSSSQVLTVSGGVPAWAAAAGGSLTSSSAYLGANVTMTNANTYYDGPTISLAAGTWLVTGVVTLEYTGTPSVATAKLWDGTTTTSSTQQTAGYSSIALSALVSPGSTTTYKISCAHQSAGCLIRAAATVNAAGNTASFLCALKVA